MKKLLITISITAGIILLIPLILFISYFFDEKDACLDMSVCKEGLEINTEYGLIKINEKNCLKYNWRWDKKRKRCNINSF